MKYLLWEVISVEERNYEYKNPPVDELQVGFILASSINLKIG